MKDYQIGRINHRGHREHREIQAPGEPHLLCATLWTLWKRMEELTTEDTEEHREIQAPGEPHLLCVNSVDSVVSFLTLPVAGYCPYAKCAWRFCCQHASLCSVQTGFSLP